MSTLFRSFVSNGETVKVVSTKFLLKFHVVLELSKIIKDKSKILKFARDVSHDFIWILYGFIVYNLESTAHFSLYIHQRLK